MFKIIGGMLVGVFFGAMMLEIVRRGKPDLIKKVEGRAKSVTDKLFEDMRATYDFREKTAHGVSPDGA
jgi:hypothetical protein